MKKLNIIAAAVLVAAASVASYASASEGMLSANLNGHADADMSAKTQAQVGLHKGLLERIKDRIEEGFKAGTVSQVNSDGSFTIQNKNGTKTETVKTDSSTTYTNDGQPADKTAVNVGAMVRVKGTLDKVASTISASIVNVIHNLQGIRVKGSITAMSGSTLTVKASDGTVYTVDASKAQVFHSFWFGTSGDIKVGDNVAVWGTHLKDSTSISARWIKDVAPKPANAQ